MSQGWIASTVPLTAQEFVEGERIKRFHYCVDGVGRATRLVHKAICGQVTVTGRHTVWPGKPSQSRLCERCERLYEERIRAA